LIRFTDEQFDNLHLVHLVKSFFQSVKMTTTQSQFTTGKQVRFWLQQKLIRVLYFSQTGKTKMNLQHVVRNTWLFLRKMD